MPELNMALFLVPVESISIFVFLAILFNLRRTLGNLPFAMAAGVLLFFSGLSTTAGETMQLYGTMHFHVGTITCYLPLLTAYLMLYVIAGTAESQRFIIGGAAVYGFSLLLTTFSLQLVKAGGSGFTPGTLGETLNSILNASRSESHLQALAHLVDFFVVPIAYTRLRNYGGPGFFPIWTALNLSLVVNLFPNAILMVAVGRPISTASPGDIIIWLATVLLLSVLLHLYLMLWEKESRKPIREKSPFAILFTFLGGYQHARKLELDLLEWENRYQSILKNTDSPILFLEQDGTIADANAAAEHLFNPGSRRTIIGRTPETLHHVRIKTQVPLYPAPERTISFTMTVTAGDDSWETRTLKATLQPLRLGEHTLTVFIGRDVTEELRQSEQIGHAQRLESIGLLAGGIAHDFNNYINAILGHADVATMLCGDMSDDVRTHVEKIAAIAEKAAKLPRQLLDFARKGNDLPRKIDLPPFLQDCFSMLPPAKAVNVDFQLHPDEGEWNIFADLTHMRQAVLNLMINALDAMADVPLPHTLTIRIGHANDSKFPFSPPQELADARSEKYLFFSIADNGCGMDDRVRKHLFDPFFTTKPAGSGTGMGLSMVYGAVSRANGWIEVASAPGNGTVFCIYLPDQTCMAANPEAPAEPPTAHS